MTVYCSNCGLRIDLVDHRGHKVVTCPGCGDEITAAVELSRPARLVRQTKPDRTEEHPLGDGLIMGRDDRSQLQVLDAQVSRQHAEIYRQGDRYLVRDLQSTNGTFLNGTRLAGAESLKDRDSIQVGTATFTYLAAGVSRDVESLRTPVRMTDFETVAGPPDEPTVVGSATPATDRCFARAAAVSAAATVAVVRVPTLSLCAPFGRIECRKAGGRLFVEVGVVPVPRKDRVAIKTGIVLDGSSSMVNGGAYGYDLDPSIDGPIRELVSGPETFACGYEPQANRVQPLARRLVVEMARDLDRSGRTRVIYGSCGAGGALLEESAELSERDAGVALFEGPSDWGTGSRLAPSVERCVQLAEGAEWGVFVVVTDGAFEDLQEVADISRSIAREIATGRRAMLSMNLVCLGESTKEGMDGRFGSLLDPCGLALPIWQPHDANQIRGLADLFIRYLDEAVVVAPWAKVWGPRGELVTEWREGVPAVLKFDLPGDAPHFDLEVAEGRVRQALPSL